MTVIDLDAPHPAPPRHRATGVRTFMMLATTLGITALAGEPVPLIPAEQLWTCTFSYPPSQADNTPPAAFPHSGEFWVDPSQNGVIDPHTGQVIPCAAVAEMPSTGTSATTG